MNYLKDRVTIYEVAKASGVSLATVSRVINKHDNVTPETRARVEATIQRLGYKPSGLAQALATNKSTYIGVVIPSANYVYIANMLNGINEVAKEKGFVVLLLVTSHKQKDALSMAEKVITSHVDGAIIFDDDLDADQINKIGSYNVPLVVINNNVTGDRVASIEFDYDKNLKETLSKVLETPNHPKMTFLHVSNAGRLLDRMEKVFVDLHHQYSSSYEVYDCDDSYTKTYNDFLERFKTVKTGYYIAYRDSIAAAIINAATDSGLKVPEDVEVLSMIGTKYANIIRPTITSMHIDMQEVGRQSARMLDDLINNRDINKHYSFESSFSKRNSTKD